ncbi:hypothetical protein FRB99_001728 [Tulasnella sp. 403]|nr:hypothetical protein FRB99_001728 [Tulasnella sp. 403]
MLPGAAVQCTWSQGLSLPLLYDADFTGEVDPNGAMANVVIIQSNGSVVAYVDPLRGVLEEGELEEPISSDEEGEFGEPANISESGDEGSSVVGKCIQTLLAMGYKEVGDNIDGFDKDGWVYGVIVNYPCNWVESDAQVNAAFDWLLRATKQVRKVESHHWGVFAYFTHGYSMGQGQEKPLPVANGRTVCYALKEFLLELIIVKQLQYLNNVFQSWFPQYHEDYCKTMATVEGYHPELLMPSKEIPFSAFTFNMGPLTVTKPHHDANNLSYEICLDWALSSFNHLLGSHTVLHKPQVFMQMRLGHMVLFPSSCITHENIPVAKGKTHYSITAYSSGALWRYNALGGWTMTKATDDEVKALIAGGAAHWKDGCEMFTKVDVQML